MLQGLRTVIYHVPDLARAKAWYRDAFGIEPYFDEPFYVGFTIGGYELGLDPDTSATAAGAGGVVAYWGVERIEGALEHFVRQGASVRTRFRTSAVASGWPPWPIRSGISSG